MSIFWFTWSKRCFLIAYDKAYKELGTPDAPCNLLVRREDVTHSAAIKERLPGISTNLNIESNRSNFYPQLRFIIFLFVSHGGIVLTAANNSIVCENTLGLRIQVAAKRLFPVFKSSLFTTGA